MIMWNKWPLIGAIFAPRATIWTILEEVHKIKKYQKPGPSSSHKKFFKVVTLK